MPAKSRPAHHANRRNNHRAGCHDHRSVGIATTIPATVCAGTAAFRSLGAKTCEAQQGGECGNRKNFSAHLFGSFKLGSGCLRPTAIATITSPALCSLPDEPGVNNGGLGDGACWRRGDENNFRFDVQPMINKFCIAAK
jgi:hypothetical protein